MKNTERENGYIGGAVVANIVLGILVLVFGSVMIWALVQYNDASNNLEQKIIIAQKDAKDAQEKEDQKAFDQKEKSPTKEFVGPQDYGRVDFKYPKTWSVYIENDGLNGGQYSAYLNPDTVPSTTSSTSKFALRVSVVPQSYDQVLQSYSGQVKQGSLRSSDAVVNGFIGQRFEGSFNKDVNGAAVVFKIRDKTLILKTDSTSFISDFNDIVLKDLKFQQ